MPKMSSTQPRCGFALPFVASLRSISIMDDGLGRVIAGASIRHRCLAVTAYDCRRPAVAAAARTCMRADAAATVLRVERRFRACVHLYIGRRRPGKTKDILPPD
jgi:hypothetical protein